MRHATYVRENYCKNRHQELSLMKRSRQFVK